MTDGKQNLSICVGPAADSLENHVSMLMVLKICSLIKHVPACLAPTMPAPAEGFDVFEIAGDNDRKALLYEAKAQGGREQDKVRGDGSGRGAGAHGGGGDGCEPWMQELYNKIPSDFNIGLLVGDTGTGKSVFLRCEARPFPCMHASRWQWFVSRQSRCRCWGIEEREDSVGTSKALLECMQRSLNRDSTPLPWRPIPQSLRLVQAFFWGGRASDLA